VSWKNLENPENMYEAKRLLTLDANVFVAALKRDEPHSDECVNILNKVPTEFLLCEPSIVYQEVCGTIARKIDLEAAKHAEQSLSKLIHPLLLITCDKSFCLSSYKLCHEYKIYSIDALYLKTALDFSAILVSLDKEDFIDKIKSKKPRIEVYHVEEFPY